METTHIPRARVADNICAASSISFGSSAMALFLYRLFACDNTGWPRGTKSKSGYPSPYKSRHSFRIPHYVLDCGPESASSTNSWIAGRAREISLTCRLSSGKCSSRIIQPSLSRPLTNRNDGPVSSEIPWPRVRTEDWMS